MPESNVDAQRRPAIAADLVLIGHALFVLFAVFGGLLLIVDFRFAFLHLPADTPRKNLPR
jgi:hypothetical protein